ncbi:MAG TPA: cell wall-binding repeat-containing protein, partial [Acidimicrobiales bacterium]|nr:cell wall-binding repeat-containing protein [Acidimicrobiales bacterium]
MELHRVRRRLTALAALTALTSTVLQLGAPAGATEDVTSERLAGQDRFATAAEIADAAFPDGSDTVLVASGRSFPDALAGAALGLPILLTEPDSLPAATATALDDLGADEAIILGGSAAVSDAVADEVAEHATVSRLAGDDRYETAAEIATSLGATGVGSVDGKKTAIIATGRDFADALAGGPLATGGAGALALPILLVSTSVPAATSAALDELGITQVLILGGTAAVSSQVESDLEDETGNPAVRLAGDNRYATAVDIAEFALDTLDFPGDDALLANGVVFADALAGGPLGGVRQAPLLLTTAATLSDESEAFFEDHSSTIDTITTLGGTAAVSASTASSAESAAETPSETRTNEDITVTPTASANQANGSSREYTATGLGTTVVDIVIVPCNNVTTTSAGETRFANSNANTVADRTKESGDDPDEASTPAAITEVNGESMPAEDPTRTNNDYVPNVAPDNGSVTFTVTGPSGAGAASSCVIPVVFVDENFDDALNVPTTNPAAPTEPFGTGGSVTFSPSAQGAGQFSARNVESTDK